MLMLCYLQVVDDEADRLRLPLYVVRRGAAEGHRAVLCGPVSDLSITQTTQLRDERHIYIHNTDTLSERLNSATWRKSLELQPQL